MASRTKKGIKNSSVAMIYYVLSVLLGFVSRKIFIDCLGADILGLNSTAQNLLGFLNLAELGIGSAIAFTLYKPLAVNDRQTVEEIVTVQGWLYRKIANVVVIGACVLMCFFPKIFSNTGLPLWYAYTSFGVFLYSSLLTYYTNFKQILLSANQEEYKITYSYKFVFLVQSFVQILAISFLPNPYIWWIVIHFVFATIAAWNLNRTIRKDYPNLRTNLARGKELSNKYPIIITKVKQLFVHRISLFVLNQTSSLIIFAYTTLKMVAVYNNYMLIINNVAMMLTSVFNGVTAGVGNLVAEGDKKRILSVFNELFSSRFFFASLFVFCLYHQVSPFVELWVGSEFVLSKITLLVMLAIFYIRLTRTTIDAYISAYGLFHDIYAPVIEAVLNLSLSFLFGYYWGITGVLSGALVSLVLVVFLWKPYFVFTRALCESIWIYIRMYFIHLFCGFAAAFVTTYIYTFIRFISLSWFAWVANSLMLTSIYGVLLFLLLHLLTPGMKAFVHRFVKIKRA